MYFPFLLTLLGSFFCITIVNGDDRAERYLLPRKVIPHFYDVKLYFDPNNNVTHFTGEVTIRTLTVDATNEIVLHAMGMTIERDAVRVFHESGPDDNLVEDIKLETDDTQFLRIHLKRELLVSEPITININYLSQYAANMFGVYVSSYMDESREIRLVTSQLQPTYARRAFPCFDEPALKAVFRTTIFAEASFDVVRTNMPYKNPPTAVGSWMRHEFQDTPVMSTYLHGYLVSNFENVDNQNSELEEDPQFRLPFKVYSRTSTQSSAAFALDLGQRSMVSLENYYGFNYALPKLDKVAVPDFAAGAMENWGLCIYREVALLVRDGVTTTATKQNVARIIVHENVHLWIGNEVTPISWTYLWLSEGLATFFDHFATDFVLPWRMNDQFLLVVQNVFQSDAVLSVNPMTHPVYTPSEVLGTFNAVAYQKSGSVMRMLQHILTPAVFQQGLDYYIHAMSRKAAAPSDLYFHMQRALSESSHSIPYTVGTILERWAIQGGFPVLTITRSAPEANSVTIRQERYLTDRSLNSSNVWHVPINWVLSSSPDFSDTRPMSWVPPGNAVSLDIRGLSENEWFIFNKQQTGYYRVNYDLGNWAALTNVLHADHNIIHYLNRANLLDDAFNLARNGRLNYNYTLTMSQYLVNETDYIPWGAVNPAFTYLDVVLGGTDVYSNFQNYIRNLTEPLYKDLGFTVNVEEEYVTPFLRNIILDLNCRHGNEHCINTSAEILAAYQANSGEAINPDIQTLVYCSSLRGGSAENFNYLWAMYQRSTDSSQHAILLNAMGCTTNVERRSFYLDQVVSSVSTVRDQDRHTIIVAVINSSPEGATAALDFIIENFEHIQPNVQALTGTTNILNALARRLTNETHTEKMNDFERRHSVRFSAGEIAAVAAIRENIAASIAWRTQNAATIEAWLKENYSNKGAAVTASLILLITLFITIFN